MNNVTLDVYHPQPRVCHDFTEAVHSEKKRVLQI